MTCRTLLLASTGIALLMCAAPTMAQSPQKEEKASPSHTPSSKSTGGDERATQNEHAKKNVETERRGEPKGSKGTAQGEGKNQPGNTTSEPPRGSGAAMQREPSARGSAETRPKEQTGKGTVQGKQPEQQRTGAATDRGGSKDSKNAKGPSGASRVQLSEQQRTNVHADLMKETNVNRAGSVNFSINVGTRVPRTVRLVALPATIISLVPQYRDYQYFVVDDEVCIVDPQTLEIVDVISSPGRMASTGSRGGSATLALTAREKRLIVDNVNLADGSTLALGSLSEGAPVPSQAQIRSFPDAVVKQVPKVRNYKYFTTENRVAIVDPQGGKVQLVIEGQR